MRTYCINYNLGNPNRDYKSLIDAIKSLANGWCHAGGSHWFINSSLTTSQVRDHLKGYLDGNDQLIVHEVGDKWASWQMPRAVTDWLLANWHSACRVS